MHVIILIAR